MLSKKSGKLFKIVIRWCNICGGMPFIWNGRRGQVCITRRGQIRWGAAFIVQLGLCIYTYFRLFQLVTNLGNLQQCKSRKIVNMIGQKLLKLSTPESLVKIDAELAYCFIHALIHTFMIALNINTILNQRAIVLFTNSYLKFTSHFREAYIVRLSRTWKNGCEDLVQLMIIIAISAPLFATIHFFFNPWHPMYLTYHLVSIREEIPTTQLVQADVSIVIHNYGLVITILLLGTFAVVQILFIGVIASTILFLTVNVTISAFVFRSAIREMTVKLPKNQTQRRRGNARHAQYLIPIYVTKDKLRTSSSLIRCYRSFQIVETLAHYCFSELAFVVEALEIFLNSLIIFVLIQFSQRLSTGSTLLLLQVIFINYLIWNFILSIVGRFKSRTLRCCESWKYVKCKYVDEFRYMKKVKNSCHPITIWAGNNIFEMNTRHIPLFLYVTACNVIVWNAMYQNNYC